MAALTRVLVLNAGSSSLKASVLEVGVAEPLASAQVDWGSDATRVAERRATVERALAELWQTVDRTTVAGAGHRIVHGGVKFREPTVVDDGVLDELDGLSALAPLHNAVALDTLRAQRDLLPALPAVAVFDTGFHVTLPEETQVYPLPWHWYTEWGVRRYGFHGLSVEWAVRRAGELLGRRSNGLEIVVAHLGSGCSATAVAGGRSVATSMGLTPLEGLMMGTRAGSIDPGILLYVLREHGVSPDELAEVLDHGSGLLGVSGISGDVRDVTAAATAGSERAQLALDMFTRRAAEGIAAAAVALPRLDALVFTGGIGEHAADVRSAICTRLSVLGVPGVGATAVDEDTVLTPSGAKVAVLRIEAREDIVVAESAAALLAGG